MTSSGLKTETLVLRHTRTSVQVNFVLVCELKSETDPCGVPSRHRDDPTDPFHHLSLRHDHQILDGSGLQQVTEHTHTAVTLRTFTGFVSHLHKKQPLAAQISDLRFTFNGTKHFLHVSHQQQIQLSAKVIKKV